MDFYESLLRFYPRSFRERFGRDMRRAFAAELASAEAKGAGRRAVFLAASAVHAFWFGSLERLPKGPVMRSFFQFDLRAAFRSLRSTPVVTLIALASLALGIGANTALFSILNGLVLKPLPVKSPEELVLIDDSLTNPIWEAIRERAPKFSSAAFAWSPQTFDLAKAGKVDRVDGVMASGGMFDMLGVSALLGRTFTPADDVRGDGPDGPVAVISERMWRRRFGGDPGVLGRPMLIERRPFTIIGVLPASFEGPDVGRVADVIIPISTDRWLRGAESSLDQRSTWWLSIMLRRPQGWTTDQVAAALNGARPGIRDAAMPQNWNAKMQAGFLSEPFTLVSAATGQSNLRSRYAQPLTIILIVVGAVLVIACANIANLLLARATARRHEMSVRLALGASRARLARQLLTESLLLAFGGGLLGLVVAQVASRVLVHQLETSVSTVTLDLAPDWRVLAFTAGVSIFTSLLFGLAPAVGLSRVSPNDALKEQSRSVTGDRRFGIRNTLVVAQVALSLALIVGAGLFLRTFASLTTTPLGFDPSHLLLASVNIRQSATTTEERAAMYQRVLESVSAAPGVRHAAVSFTTPTSGSGWNTIAKVDGGPQLTGRAAMGWINSVSPGWFQTYGMHILAGRDVAATDTAGAQPVVVVNETFVKRFVGDGDPIGRVVTADINGGDNRVTIVGVVSDAIYRNSRQGVYATLYLPFLQSGGIGPSFQLTADIAVDSQAAQRELSAALDRVDSRLSYAFRDLSDQVRASTSQERLVAMLSGFFGALALLLAGMGLYGVTSYAVNRRRSEIALRMALGATTSSVVRMILRQAGWLVFTGVAIGLGVSVWASKFVSTLLFGLTPRDPVTLGAAMLGLIVIGGLAAWLPARRASRLDPTVALRE